MFKYNMYNVHHYYWELYEFLINYNEEQFRKKEQLKRVRFYHLNQQVFTATIGKNCLKLE